MIVGSRTYQLKPDGRPIGGWTAVGGRERPISYHRQLSYVKENPPEELSQLIVREFGCQYQLLFGGFPKTVEYREIAVAAVRDGSSPAAVIGSRVIVPKASLLQAEMDDDEKAIRFVIGPSSEQNLEIVLEESGELSVELVPVSASAQELHDCQ